MVNGYQVISIKGTAFATGVAQTVGGIWAKLDLNNENGKKPVLLEGLALDGKSYIAVYAPFYKDATNYKAHIPYGGDKGSDVLISNKDRVTITVTV